MRAPALRTVCAVTAPTPRRRLRASAAAVAGVVGALVLLAPASAPAMAAVEPPAGSTVVMTSELQAQIQGMVDGFLAENTSVPGISVAVVTPDEGGADPVITTFVAGVEDLVSRTPV